MDRVIIHVRKYRKALLVRYIDWLTGEIVYDMEYHHIDAPLSEIISGIEKLATSYFGTAAISWDVNYE